MFSFSQLDARVTDLLNTIIPPSPLLNSFFSFFSLQGNAFFIWVFLILVALIFEERRNPGISKRDISFITTFLICFILASLFSQIIIKNLVKRERPCSPKVIIESPEATDDVIKCLEDYSFPSSHATTALAAATVISAFDNKRKWVYFLVAILISYSRIYLGYHYFLDVVAGGILGWTLSKIAIFQLRRTSRGHL